MKKYKIDNYIVTANSVHDAVSIVRQIKDEYSNGIILEKHETYKGPNGQFTVVKVRRDNGRIQYVVTSDKRDIDAGDKMPAGTIENDLASAKKTAQEYATKRTWDAASIAKDAEPHSIKFEGARIEYAESNHNTSGVDTWTTPDKINKWLERENLSAYEKYKKRGGGYDKIHIDFKYLIDGKHYAFHALRVDIGESSKFHKIENGDIDFVTQVIKKHFKHSDTLPQGLKPLDSVKDSVTVREVIESLVTEETSAIASYNVALETLKDHIPAEAYEAIKAIRDDEQRHVENLYAVLNGNVTPKNLEN